MIEVSARSEGQLVVGPLEIYAEYAFSTKVE